MNVIIIASGSKGNCAYIDDGETSILIDAGVSYKKAHEALEKYNITNNLSGVFITHEHIDHVSGLKAICNKMKVEAFLTEKTYQRLSCKEIGHSYIESNRPVYLGSLKITPVMIFHDAADPVGFIIESLDKRIVYITDTGYVHSSILDKIKNADAYILESNHDPDVLMNSERPFELKRRILGDRGHLCNEDSAVLLTQVIGPKTKHIVHAHISAECNLNELIIDTMKNVFEENGKCYSDYIAHCASQDEVYQFEV